LRRTAAIALLTLLVAARADAYVRYRTDQGNPFFWSVSCVPVTIYLNGFDQMAMLTANVVAKSAAAAAHTWSPEAVTCGSGAATTHPYLEIVPSLAADGVTPPPAMYDAHNSVIFRTELWRMSGRPTGKAYDAAALAITSVFAKPDGHIVDADIEVNATAGGPLWANLDPDSMVTVGHGLDVHDLQNTLTHEFGHFIGLDHTCATGFVDPTNPKPWPHDDMNRAVPYCSDAPESIRQTVMFDSATAGETSKRTLSADDSRAVCEIYPAAQDPYACTLDAANDGCGCVTARGSRPGLGALLAAAAWFAVRRRRESA
jgi:MYXO-CTERM domain-containing protein